MKGLVVSPNKKKIFAIKKGSNTGLKSSLRAIEWGFLQDTYNGAVINMALPLQKQLHTFSLLWISFRLVNCSSQNRHDNPVLSTSFVVVKTGLRNFTLRRSKLDSKQLQAFSFAVVKTRAIECGFLQDTYNGAVINMALPLQKQLHTFSLLWISFGLVNCRSQNRHDNPVLSTSFVVVKTGLRNFTLRRSKLDSKQLQAFSFAVVKTGFSNIYRSSPQFAVHKTGFPNLCREQFCGC